MSPKMRLVTYEPAGGCERLGLLLGKKVVDLASFAACQAANDAKTAQDVSTGDMAFKVPETIEFISGFVMLDPGDIIATGTRMVPKVL